jgi:amidase
LDSADLVFAGITKQAKFVALGEVSPTELVNACLERIERLDPYLNAFRVVFAEKARAEAKQAERRGAAGGDRPLLGVPFAIKDDAA